MWCMATGFGGHYTNKASSTREGEATFHRLSRFRLAARKDLKLKDCFVDLLQPPSQNATNSQAAQRAQRHVQFEPMLRTSPHLQQVLQGVATVAQMTLLEPVHGSDGTPGGSGKGSVEASASGDSTLPGPSQDSICVVNTHFFFHPNASHVRNIHAAAILSEVQAFMQEQSTQASVSNGSRASTANMSAGAIAESQTSDVSEGVSDNSKASVSGQPKLGQQPALVFSGDLNSDFNDGTPGTASEAPAGSRHADSQPAGRAPQPALLFCGDLNCGLSHGTPGSTCTDVASPVMSAQCLLNCSASSSFCLISFGATMTLTAAYAFHLYAAAASSSTWHGGHI